MSNSQVSGLSYKITSEKARNGKEAVSKYKERFNFKCYDEHCTKKYIKLIIMDLMMPVMDGIEATKEILAFEALKGSNQCDIVALTSNTDKQTMEKCKRYGFREVLQKPLDFQSLKRIACLYHFKMTEKEY